MDTLVLTAIGDDRPGLVSALSARLTDHGASWERSQMARLAGKFAGIVEVAVPAGRTGDLLRDLERMAEDGLVVLASVSQAPSEPVAQALALTVVGSDRPGIVAEISSLLSDRGISIDELSTTVRDAPMAGGMLFEAQAALTVRDGEKLDTAALRVALEQLADELMVEVVLADQG